MIKLKFSYEMDPLSPISIPLTTKYYNAMVKVTYDMSNNIDFEALIIAFNPLSQKVSSSCQPIEVAIYHFVCYRVAIRL